MLRALAFSELPSPWELRGQPPHWWVQGWDHPFSLRWLWCYEHWPGLPDLLKDSSYDLQASWGLPLEVQSRRGMWKRTPLWLSWVEGLSMDGVRNGRLSTGMHKMHWRVSSVNTSITASHAVNNQHRITCGKMRHGIKDGLAVNKKHRMIRGDTMHPYNAVEVKQLTTV